MLKAELPQCTGTLSGTCFETSVCTLGQQTSPVRMQPHSCLPAALDMEGIAPPIIW